MAGNAKNVLVLGASFGTPNMGVGALAAGALEVVSRRYPGAEVKFLDYGHAATTEICSLEGRPIPVELINLRFSWKVLLPNNVAYLIILAILMRVGGTSFASFLRRRNSWLAKIDAADVAVAVSGGDSFSDIYGLGRFFYVSLPQCLVLMLGKRLVLLPQTIGPFDKRLSCAVARQIMRRADRVYSRDASGVEEVRSLIGDKWAAKAHFCYDMGFVLRPRPPAAIDLNGPDAEHLGDRPLVGVNVSGLLVMGGYDKNNRFGLRANYADLTQRMVDLFINRKGANVILVPHVFGNDEESDVTAVAAAYDLLKERYPDRLYCLRGVYDSSEIKYVIGRCDFFVGARMHSCIAALSQNIPAVGIAYSQKFAGVLQSVGVGQLVADPRCQSIEEILALVDQAFARRIEISAQLERKMTEVRRTILHMLDGVG